MTNADLKPSRRWAVACVFTGSEKTVVNRLKRLGCEAQYLVNRTKCRKGPRRRETEIERAAFPGYLFVDIDTVANFEELRFTEGFFYFLVTKRDGRIILLDDEQMDALHELEAKGLLNPKIVETVIAAGSHVRIEASAFAGLRGVVEKVEKGRARLVEGDFAERPVWIPEDILKAEEGED